MSGPEPRLPHPYRGDIDGLRAVAVVAVIAGHAGIPFVPGGFVGVDVFFVISGFLIAGILAREFGDRRFSLIRFYERRARRILPALLVMLAAVLAVGLVLSPPGILVLDAKAAFGTLLFVSNIVYLRRLADYFAPSSELEGLLHTWSLAVEEQFYLVVPVLLWALWRSGGRRRAVLGILVLTAASFVLALVLLAGHPRAAFYHAPARAWELGIGALLALGTLPRLGNRALREAVALAGFAAILLPVVLYDAATPFPGVAAVPPVLGAALVILCGMEAGRAPTLVTRLLASRPLVAVGLVSYSLYLWHWPVLVALRRHSGTVDLPADAVAVALVLTAVLGVASWRFVEQPFRVGGAFGRRQRRQAQGQEQGRESTARPERLRVLGAAAAGMAAVAALGLIVVVSDGFPDRVPPDAARAYAGSTDRWYPGDCDGRLPADGLCRIGVPGAAKDVLLWGDSHAGSMQPGVDAALLASNLGGATAVRYGCLPLLGVERLDVRPGSKAACETFTQAVLAYLGTTEDFGTVVLSGRWALFSDGTRVAGEFGNPVELRVADAPDAAAPRVAGAPSAAELPLADAPDAVRPRAADAANAADRPLADAPGAASPASAEDKDAAGNAAAFARGLTATVAAIRATGRRVVIIDSVPEIGWDVPVTIGNGRFLGTADPAPPALADVTARNARANAVIAALARDPGVVRVSLAKTLCTPVCRVRAGEQLFYSDDDHMSASGARLVLAPLLAPVFTQLFAVSRGSRRVAVGP